MKGAYAKYQARYRTQLKESDRQLLKLLADVLSRGDNNTTIVDIGCHTGNLLHHIRKQHPRASLIGWDIFSEVIQSCKADPLLSGVTFDIANVLDLKHEALVDVAVLSAVLGRFSDADYERAWAQVHKLLRPGGAAIVFDWMHPFRQTIKIIEETDLHPEGLTLNMRSQTAIEKQLRRLGFNSVHFVPFQIEVDLQRSDAGDAVSTYTRMTVDGERLQFRGAIYQPWCHMVATRP